MSYRRKVWLARMVFLAVALGLIEVAPRAHWVDVLTLVPLSAMLRQLWDYVTTGQIWRHFWATSSTILWSFILATATGIPAGTLLWRLPALSEALNPYLTSYYALPVFAFYPVLIAILGVNARPIIAISWAWAVVAVVINTLSGFQQVPAVFRKMASVYRLSRWRSFWSVYFPSASPYIFNGVKLAATYSIIGVVASEFILAPQGLGWLVAYNYNNFGLKQMYASILVILLFTIAMNGVVSLVERRVWGERRVR